MKNIIRCISEIIFAVVLIFVSYFAWDRIDVDAYERDIAKYNLRDIALELENDFSEIGYLSDENAIDNTILYVNNYQNKVYQSNIFLVLNDLDINNLDSFYLSIDEKVYNLKDIYVSDINDQNYFLIDNVNLSEYEKTNYNLKLLVDDSYDFSNFSGLSYRIEEEIIG